MCTAISFKSENHYFGRTLDLEYHYDESIVISPRNFPFSFTDGTQAASHFAIIGTATVVDGYPLYYEATNEKGLSIAGLNFPHNAHYFPACDGKKNVAPFEFIPWALSRYSTVQELREALQTVNITDISFSENFASTPLHWIIADKERCITAESVEDGMKIYDNPFGVLTNNPPFGYQTDNYKRVMSSLGIQESDPKMNSKGLDAFGLPGDLSSPSRFARTAYAKEKSVCGGTEEESVVQFFHILGTADVPKGLIDEKYRTVYTSCCNTDKGIFYYTTYGNTQISAVDMHKENLDSCGLISYPLVTKLQINSIN